MLCKCRRPREEQRTSGGGSRGRRNRFPAETCSVVIRALCWNKREHEKENPWRRSGHPVPGRCVQSFPPGASCVCTRNTPRLGPERLCPRTSAGAGERVRESLAFPAAAPGDSRAVVSESPGPYSSFAAASTPAARRKLSARLMLSTNVCRKPGNLKRITGLVTGLQCGCLGSQGGV